MKNFLFRKTNTFTVSAVCILTFFGISCTIHAAEFIPMGIPADLTGSWARGVSDDGNVVAGTYRREGGSNSGGPFVWTPETGVVPIPSLPAGYEFFNLASKPVSGDGSVVVGWLAGLRNDSFRRDLAVYDLVDGWRVLETSRDLSEDWEATAVSYDGSVIVGDVGWFQDQATRWTASEGAIGLGWLPGHDESTASDVSADGSIVVGVSRGEPDGNSSTPRVFNNNSPFVWSEATGMIDLGVEGDFTVISDDGSVVGGAAIVSSSTDGEAFIWTEETGVVGLGWLPGSEVPRNLQGTWGTKFSAVNAINGDGSVIVGNSGFPIFGAPSGTPFIWTEQSGMQDLQQLLIDQHGLGPDLAGWNLWGPQDISANGQFITGIGINPDGAFEGWLVRLDTPIPEPSTGLLALAGSLLLVLQRRRHRVKRTNPLNH